VKTRTRKFEFEGWSGRTNAKGGVAYKNMVKRSRYSLQAEFSFDRRFSFEKQISFQEQFLFENNNQ